MSLDIEADRLKFEREQFAAEQALKEAELRLQEQQFEEKKEQARRGRFIFFGTELPAVGVTVIVTLITVGSALGTSLIQGCQSRILEQDRFSFQHSLEQQKFAFQQSIDQQKFDFQKDSDLLKLESDLLLSAIKTGDVAVAKKNILFLLDADLLKDRSGRIRAATANPETTPVLPSEMSSGGQLTTVNRSFEAAEFRDYLTTIEFTTWKPEFVVIHHTASPLAQSPDGFSEQQLETKRWYYGEVLNWKGAPHLFVDQNRIWVFNPLNKPGTHSLSFNRNSIGLELLGDYNTEAMDPRVFENAAQAVAALCSSLGMDPDKTRLHSEDRKTRKACPGKNFNKSEFIKRVKAIMGR